MREQVDFLQAFLRSPLSMGAVAPSSRALAERMLEGLDLRAAGTVVEVGPGTGAFTGAILEAVSDDGLVLAVEIDGEFAARLESRYPELRVAHDSVENLPGQLAEAGRSHADVVLCGLPWAAFPADKQANLLGSISRSLRAGGDFVTFAYVHGAGLPWGRHFRRLLERSFSEVRTSPVVWRNLPPAIVYRCRK